MDDMLSIVRNARRKANQDVMVFGSDPFSRCVNVVQNPMMSLYREKNPDMHIADIEDASNYLGMQVIKVSLDGVQISSSKKYDRTCVISITHEHAGKVILFDGQVCTNNLNGALEVATNMYKNIIKNE